MATLHLHVGGLLALLRRGGRAAAAHDRGVRHVVGREDVAVGGRRRLGLAPVQRRGLLRHPDAGGVSAQPRPQPRPPQQPQPLPLPGELQRGGRVQPQLQAQDLPPTQPQEEAQGVQALAIGLSLQLV